MRDTHCRFKRLNTNGKCIACCHYNIQSDSDCTGKTGKTLATNNGREVQVSGRSGNAK